MCDKVYDKSQVSTHSRPKAAGCNLGKHLFTLGSFNTQPPEGDWVYSDPAERILHLFQHTAARRRLVQI